MKPVVQNTVRCHVAILPETDGTFSAIVLNLPGVGSCGDTAQEALATLKEALTETIASFHADGEDVPWLKAGSYVIPSGAKLQWISVNG